MRQHKTKASPQRLLGLLFPLKLRPLENTNAVGRNCL